MSASGTWNGSSILKAGFTKKDDTLPKRLLKDAAKTGPAEGKVNGLDKMLPEYYELRGWTKDGVPTNETLNRLALLAGGGRAACIMSFLGAGPAGVLAADTLRKLDGDAQITLVSGEKEPPYSRMAIPYLLANHIEEDGTYLRQDADHYANHAIDVMHARTTGIDPKKEVGRAGKGARRSNMTACSSPPAPVRSGTPCRVLTCRVCIHAGPWRMPEPSPASRRKADEVVLMGAGFYRFRLSWRRSSSAA